MCIEEEFIFAVLTGDLDKVDKILKANIANLVLNKQVSLKNSTNNFLAAASAKIIFNEWIYENTFDQNYNMYLCNYHENNPLVMSIKKDFAKLMPVLWKNSRQAFSKPLQSTSRWLVKLLVSINNETINALNAAILAKHTEIAALLINSGIDLNATVSMCIDYALALKVNNGLQYETTNEPGFCQKVKLTSLDLALVLNRPEIVELIFKKSPNPDEKLFKLLENSDEQGFIPQGNITETKYNLKNVLEIYDHVDYIVPLFNNLDFKYTNNNTLLHLAIQKGFNRLAITLINAGACTSIVNKSKKTPLQYCSVEQYNLLMQAVGNNNYPLAELVAPSSLQQITAKLRNIGSLFTNTNNSLPHAAPVADALPAKPTLT
jgi:ankyrin repeat protein